MRGEGQLCAIDGVGEYAITVAVLPGVPLVAISAEAGMFGRQGLYQTELPLLADSMASPRTAESRRGL